MGTMLAGPTLLLLLLSWRSQPSSVACMETGEDVNSESTIGSGYESTTPGGVDETEEPEYEGTEYIVPSEDGDEQASGVE